MHTRSEQRLQTAPTCHRSRRRRKRLVELFREPQSHTHTHTRTHTHTHTVTHTVTRSHTRPHGHTVTRSHTHTHTHTHTHGHCAMLHGADRHLKRQPAPVGCKGVVSQQGLLQEHHPRRRRQALALLPVNNLFSTRRAVTGLVRVGGLLSMSSVRGRSPSFWIAPYWSCFLFRPLFHEATSPIEELIDEPFGSTTARRDRAADDRRTADVSGNSLEQQQTLSEVSAQGLMSAGFLLGCLNCRQCISYMKSPIKVSCIGK